MHVWRQFIFGGTIKNWRPKGYNGGLGPPTPCRLFPPFCWALLAPGLVSPPAASSLLALLLLPSSEPPTPLPCHTVSRSRNHPKSRLILINLCAFLYFKFCIPLVFFILNFSFICNFPGAPEPASVFSPIGIPVFFPFSCCLDMQRLHFIFIFLTLFNYIYTRPQILSIMFSFSFRFSILSHWIGFFQFFPLGKQSHWLTLPTTLSLL